MATDSSMSGPAGWAPVGTTILERLGVGSVFEVARVRDQEGRERIAKRIAPHARSSVLAGAIERERSVLSLARGSFVPELIVSGNDARGGFVVETLAQGAALRHLAGG